MARIAGTIGSGSAAGVVPVERVVVELSESQSCAEIERVQSECGCCVLHLPVLSFLFCSELGYSD